MNKFYVTFGQTHAHQVNGHALNKDTVAVIQSPNSELAYERALILFGCKWAYLYGCEPAMHFYPGGLVEL